MNLSKLFEMQKTLDERIEKEHPRQDGEDRLAKKILALQVELGELANEWRGFKFWSKDQEPRTFVPNLEDVCEKCKGVAIFNQDKPLREWENCDECDGVGVHFHNALLEEYVDCLHFILSIGLEMKIENADLHITNEYTIGGDISKLFSELIALPTDVKFALDINDFGYHVSYFEEILCTFIELGDLLGFTWEQIEQAYISKNEVNHERQKNNY